MYKSVGFHYFLLEKFQYSEDILPHAATVTVPLESKNASGEELPVLKKIWLFQGIWESYFKMSFVWSKPSLVPIKFLGYSQRIFQNKTILNSSWNVDFWTAPVALSQRNMCPPNNPLLYSCQAQRKNGPDREISSLLLCDSWSPSMVPKAVPVTVSG